MNSKKIFHVLSIIVLLFLCASNASAQDFLARQAPVDHRSKAVDTVALQRILDIEDEMYPAYSLYNDEWDNQYAHKVIDMPKVFKIDLRNFCMPTTSRAITSNFGARWGRAHKGIDIKVYVGDTIRAAFSGKVRIVKYERKGYGNYIVIRHNNGLETIYGHLSKQLVKENQVVRAGDVIGLGGNTGRSTGSHLHFETRLCGVALNPALMFDFRAQDVTGDYYVYNEDTYQAEAAEANRLRGVIGSGGYTVEDVRGANAQAGASREPAAKSSSSRTYKVKSGDTLSSIAKKHGTTVAKICSQSGIKKNAKLRIGQILKI